MKSEVGQPELYPIAIPAHFYALSSVLVQGDVSKYVEQAIEAGFSHIDTAESL